MKRATPATKGYGRTFDRLVAEGWTLRNYGGGWRYFTRPVGGTPLVQAPNSHRDAPPTMRLHDCCRVSLEGDVEALEQQLLG